MLTINQPAPPFSLTDQHGKAHQLQNYLGKWVLVYFYPKDMTPGCITEACSFRDSYQFLSSKIIVLGVSADSSTSHKKFSDKYSLPFPLLSDPNKDMIRAYQAWGPKKFMGKEFLGILRISYLIDPQGKISKVYPKVDPKKHVAEILNHLNALQ